MNIEMDTIRFLGAAQLLVFTASTISELLLISGVGSGSTSDILVNISKNLTRMRQYGCIGEQCCLTGSAALALLSGLAINFCNLPRDWLIRLFF